MTPPPGFPSPRRRGRKRGLHGEVVDELGRMIVAHAPLTNGRLAPDDLAQHFEVSRTVMREALRSLESKGLITARPNVGTKIRPMNEWNLLDPDIIEWRALSPQANDQFSELHGLRRAMETFSARHAATTRNPDVRESLTTAATHMDDAVHRNREDLFAQADTSFHHHLIRASGSLILEHLYTTVTQGLNASAEPSTCHCTDTSVTRHWAVIDAIRQDSDNAERVTRDLLTNPAHTDPGLYSQRCNSGGVR